MSAEERKGEERVRDAAKEEGAKRREGAGSPAAGPSEESDPREDEGWSQPEASTQKGVARQPEDGGRD